MAPKPKPRTATRDADLLGAVGELLDDLTRFACEPTLVGGMALVVLGSPRVTKDVDFPIPAHEVRGRSTRKKIRSHVFHIASREDLIRMKEIAVRDRSAPGDAQDLEFLRRH